MTISPFGVFAALVFVLGGLAKVRALTITFDAEDIARLRAIVSNPDVVVGGNAATLDIVRSDLVGHVQLPGRSRSCASCPLK
jgi:hypothetical protein